MTNLLPEPVLVQGEHDGTWLVTTSSGARHVLDLDAMTATRLRSRLHGPDDSWPQAALRRDGETVPLYGFEPIRLGCRAMLHLGELDDYDGYVSTRRDTTPVVSAERVSSNGE